MNISFLNNHNSYYLYPIFLAIGIIPVQAFLQADPTLVGYFLDSLVNEFK